MFFQSSPGKVLWAGICLLCFGVSAFAQTADTVVATVNGVEITQKQVDETIATSIYPLQQQLYAIRKAALDNLITSRILESEARAQGLSVEEVRRRLTLGEIRVTQAQVEEAYAQNASFFASMSPDEARERLRLDLENQVRMTHYRAGLEALKKKWPITVKLEVPRLDLDDRASPAKGPEKAAVTIVEFSDFECPFCRLVQKTLKDVRDRYPEDVRLVFKHLPSEGHRNSLPAARAAYCAAEQDRFWQFHDALFANGNLANGVFGEIARTLGLGIEKFETCMRAERSRTAVVKDIETARRLQIDGTPSFFINGRLIKGALTFAEFQSIIERELQQRSIQKTSSTN